MTLTRKTFVTGMIIVVIIVIAAGAIALAVVSAVKSRKSDPLRLSRPAERPPAADEDDEVVVAAAATSAAAEEEEAEGPVRLAAAQVVDDPYFSSLSTLGPSGDSMPSHFVTGSFEEEAPALQEPSKWSTAGDKPVPASRANPRPRFNLRENPTKTAQPFAQPSISQSPTSVTGFQSLQSLGDSGGFPGYPPQPLQFAGNRPNSGITSSTLMNPHGASAGGPPRPRDPSAPPPKKLASVGTGAGGIGMARLPPRKPGSRPTGRADPSSRRGQLLV